MKIQKLLALLLALVMVLALAACGIDETKPDADDDDPTTSTTAPAADPTDPPADPTNPPADPTVPPVENPEDPTDPEETPADPTDPVDPPVEDPTDPVDPPVDIPEDPTDPVDPPEEEPEDPTDPVDPPVESDLAQRMVGSWNTTVEVTAADLGLSDSDDTILCVMEITFNEDGTYEFTADMSSLMQILEDNQEAYIEGFLEGFYAEMGGEAAAEEACQAAFGMSCREYALLTLQQLKTIYNNLSMTGVWTVADTTVMLDGEAAEITVSGNLLTWVDEDLLESFGVSELVFDRVGA